MRNRQWPAIPVSGGAGVFSVLAMSLSLVLIGCGPFPDARNQANTPARQAERAARASQPARPPGRLADPVETACLNAAAAAGHAVVGLDPPVRPPGADRVGVRVRGPGGNRTLACVVSQATGSVRLQTS